MLLFVIAVKTGIQDLSRQHWLLAGGCPDPIGGILHLPHPLLGKEGTEGRSGQAGMTK
jgi:hypothetical protein